MNTKFFIVLLVVVALAFIGFEVMGSQNHSKSGPQTNDKNFDPGQFPQLQSMNNVLDPFSPKLHLSKTKYTLTAQKPKDTIAVPSDSSNSMRKAKFALSSDNCADLRYSPSGATDDPKLQCGPQGADFCPRYNSNATIDSLSASFLVNKEGGKIFLERKMSRSGSCEVTLTD